MRKNRIALAMIVSTLSFAVPARADTVYAYCLSTWYLLQPGMENTYTTSTCFKASSVLPDDAPNIALNYCRTQWAKKVGLSAGEAAYLDHKNESFTSYEQCATAQLDAEQSIAKNSSKAEEVGAGPVLSIFNGIVPSKVTATWMKTTRYTCDKPECR